MVWRVCVRGGMVCACVCEGEGQCVCLLITTLGLLLGNRVTDLLSTVAPLRVNSGILKNT